MTANCLFSDDSTSARFHFVFSVIVGLADLGPPATRSRRGAARPLWGDGVLGFAQDAASGRDWGAVQLRARLSRCEFRDVSHRLPLADRELALGGQRAARGPAGGAGQ